MPLDPSIYNQVGRVNLGQGIGEALTGFADRQYKLADLARQQESQARQGTLQDLQIRSAQRAEAAIPAQQMQAQQLAKQKHIQELAYGLSQGLDPQHGIDKQTLQAMTIQEARNRGLGDEDMQQLFAPLASGKDDASLSRYYLSMANPQEAQKLQLKQMYPAPKAALTPEQQRGQIIFDAQGNAYNVNPYTNEVRPVATEGKQIQGAQYAPSLQGQISGAKALGTETGKAAGEAVSGLKDIQSQLPNLEKLVTDLSKLGKKATYTKAGQVADITKRQLGIGVGEGAIARKEYISKVDNEILPLLRQTFGAAFTLKEGESLRATLGDPDASPEEKDAVLRSFIATKKSQIESLKRRTGETQVAPTEATHPQFPGFSIAR